MSHRTELILSIAIVAVSAVMLVIGWVQVIARFDETIPAADYIIYRDAAARFLDGGGFYMPEQLAGPYDVLPPVVLYPPPSLLLFVPFVYLPAVLWWLIPIGVTAWAVWAHRPRPIAWAVVAFAFANPTTQSALFWGNPAIWLVAALALGTHFGWPSVAVFLKPTLFPFALIGCWKRSWWVALAVCALVSLPFLPMWFDYATVLRNAREVQSFWFGYSTPQVPLFLIPVAAWVGGRVRGLEMPTAVFARYWDRTREPDFMA